MQDCCLERHALVTPPAVLHREPDLDRRRRDGAATGLLAAALVSPGAQALGESSVRRQGKCRTSTEGRRGQLERSVTPAAEIICSRYA